MGSKPSVQEMRQHIGRLASEYDIALDTRWIRRAADAYAIREADGSTDEIQIPPIKSAITYAVALHEIGHILGQHQTSRRPMTRERWAWQWARKNALMWTATMEQYAAEALKQAAANSEENS